MEIIQSVGIDIGTSTTQLVFSRLAIDNTAGFFSAPKVSILEKDVIYKSDVYFTPLKESGLIDETAVQQIVASEYLKAGFLPGDIQTGAVIITGESAKKENAAEILQKLARFAGDFVVSTAGPDLESVIAGKGSGAWQYSVKNQCTTVNLDVGGGTTNIVFFDHGDVSGVCCFDIGGRLVKFDRDGKISYISEAAKRVARSQGLFLQQGQMVSEDDLRMLTDRMAGLLAESIGLLPEEGLLQSLKTPGSSDVMIKEMPDEIFFSGGVAACMAKNLSDSLMFGDIGPLLAQSLLRIFSAYPVSFHQGRETLRATVIGAGTYTTSLSGSTIFYTDGVFPLKNIPIFRISLMLQDGCVRGESEALFGAVRASLTENQTDTVALFLEGIQDPTYSELNTLAQVLSSVMDRVLPSQAPILVSVSHDMAKALGIAMHRIIPKRKMAVIDDISLGQNDYIDVGQPLMNGMVVPIIVKTLLFG